MIDDLPVPFEAGAACPLMNIVDRAASQSCRRHPVPDVRRFFILDQALALLASSASNVASNASKIEACRFL